MKGLKQHRLYDSPDRVRFPLKRVGDDWQRGSWQQAFDDLMPGTVVLPHGWGHQHATGLSVASRARGVNANLLAADGPTKLEPLSAVPLDGHPGRGPPRGRPARSRQLVGDVVAVELALEAQQQIEQPRVQLRIRRVEHLDAGQFRIAVDGAHLAELLEALEPVVVAHAARADAAEG